MRPERFRRMKEVISRRQPDLTVLMERVNKPHNLSAILRNCDAVGVLEVHAVAPQGGITLHRDTSAGTARWIRVHRHPDAVSAIRILREAGLQVVAADPGPRSEDYRAIDYVAPTALLVGAELYGISGDALGAADRHVSIPMVGMARSLNVSVATALLLYEALRQRQAAGLYESPRWDAERASALLFEWAYPEVAARLRELGHAYPELDEEGGFVADRDPPKSGAGSGR